MPTPSDYQDPGQPYRNLQPGASGAPGYFTVANPTGGPPLPGRTTESSTRNGNGTQVAQVPPPTPAAATPPALTPQQKAYYDAHIAGHPGAGTEAEYAKYLADANAGNIAAANAAGRPQDAAGLTPVSAAAPTPADVKPPEPAAKPLPNLGHWTPDQAAPWLHVKPIAPQQVPDRPPDTHVGTRPAYVPRPGEHGYTVAPPPPGEPYTFGMFLGKALQHGFTGQAAYDMAAIGLAESNGYANRVHVNDGGKGFNSYGALQINGSNDAMLAKAGFPGGARAALDIDTAFAEAYVLSKGGTDFSPWSTFNDKSYLRYLDGNARPEASSTLVVGPRQAYRPSVERDPAQWGSTPERDWTPGNMPTAHDIPNILGALLPIAIAGVLGGGGLGMIAAFTGYQNARNKAQTEEAKEQKTKWKDALEETTSRLKLQLLGAKGIMAEYGDLNDPVAKEKLLELALKTDDPQLVSAIQNGDMKKVGDLLNTRDKIFQDLSKTKDAQDRADFDDAEKQREANKVREGLGLPAQPVREPGGAEPQQPFFPGSGTPAAAPPVAAPEPPAEPAPQVAPQPPPGGRPTPPAGGQPAPAEAPPPPAEEPPQQPAPPPPAGGEPRETLPPVSVSAPMPREDPLAGLTPQEQAIARDVLAGGEMPKFPAQVADSETRILGAVAKLNQQLRQVSDNPNLKDENSIASAVRRVDPLTAENLTAIAHNMMPLPGSESGTSGSGGSRSVLGYRNLMSNLARKVNPQWDPGQWGGIEKFRDPQGQTQRQIGRIAAVGDAGTKLKHDLELLPDDPVTMVRMVKQFVEQHFTSDPRYSNVFTDWQTLMIDTNALSQGSGGLEGETEQMIKSIPLYGQKAAYVGALKRHASFALSRYEQYQNQWGQLQRTDPMYGHNELAEQQVRDLANIDEGALTGGYVIQNGQKFDRATHKYLGPAE